MRAHVFVCEFTQKIARWWWVWHDRVGQREASGRPAGGEGTGYNEEKAKSWKEKEEEDLDQMGDVFGCTHTPCKVMKVMGDAGNAMLIRRR